MIESSGQIEMEHLEIRSLKPRDAPELSAMLRSQQSEYARFFHPFSFDESTISSVLSNSHRDVHTGVYLREQLVVFFMLRGWDEGFEIPAFGILVDEKHRGHGLEILSLETAKVICKLRGASRMMLKMHPENISAKGVARKIGFFHVGEESGSGNIIYHCDLTRREPE
ncbi:MAG: GNAT family N-acetyltransferase [Pyrinomonadaceae bacterium]|nr:GNAT family N-acetyltransferase [Pyrinomonadaceae bacterium]